MAQDALRHTQVAVVNECRGLAGVNETCVVVLNATACATAKCSHLVVIFSGGEMGCDSGTGYANVVANFTANGWASACLNYFETSTGSGAVPYHKEKDRLDVAIAAATASAWAAAYWTGEYLLLQGISHGASSPLVVMARYGADKQTFWKGSRGTAGCFFDGTVNQSASAELLGTGAVGGRPCTIPVAYSRWLERYCGSPVPAGCDLATNPDAVMDLIENAPPSNFSISTWRLYECGSLLPPCSGDIIPRAPYQKLCARLTTGNRSCEFKSLPFASHLTCHRDYGFECRGWFENLFPRAASGTPSQTPSQSPAATPSQIPSQSPAATPLQTPSQSPAATPSQTPSRSPAATPSQSLSQSQTASPSSSTALFDSGQVPTSAADTGNVVAGAVFGTFAVVVALLASLWWWRHRPSCTNAGPSEWRPQRRKVLSSSAEERPGAR